MKIELYMDVHSGWFDPKTAYANANPGQKLGDCKRYKLSFEINDPREPDQEIELINENVVEVEDEHVGDPSD